MDKDFFCYVARGSASLANGSNEQVTINFASDSNFVLTEIRTKGTNGLRASILDSSGKNKSNISFNCEQVGLGQDGIKFFDKPVILANTQYVVTFDNQSGGAVVYPELQLWGYKVQ